MTARRLGLISAASALVIIIVVIGVVLRRVDESHHPTESLASKAPDVSSFKDFPVFWLGDEYEGQKLDRVIEPSPDGFAQPVVLAYGSCGAKFESCCIPPIVIKGVGPG